MHFSFTESLSLSLSLVIKLTSMHPEKFQQRLLSLNSTNFSQFTYKDAALAENICFFDSDALFQFRDKEDDENCPPGRYENPPGEGGNYYRNVFQTLSLPSFQWGQTRGWSQENLSQEKTMLRPLCTTKVGPKSSYSSAVLFVVFKLHRSNV